MSSCGEKTGDMQLVTPDNKDKPLQCAKAALPSVGFQHHLARFSF